MVRKYTTSRCGRQSDRLNISHTSATVLRAYVLFYNDNYRWIRNVYTSCRRSVTCSRLARSDAIGGRRSGHPSQKRGGSSPLQTSHVTVEVVLVSGNGTGVCVLPESVVTPPVRQSADGAGIASDPQWAGGCERGAVAGAALPPIGGGVDHRIATNTGMVGIGEIPDPADHRRGGQTITSRAIWVICPTNNGWSVGTPKKLGIVIHTFDVEGTWEGNTIAGPTSAVRDEPIGLSSTRRFIWKGKVVAAANETGLCSASILGREVWVLVG